MYTVLHLISRSISDQHIDKEQTNGKLKTKNCEHDKRVVLFGVSRFVFSKILPFRLRHETFIIEASVS